MSILIFSPFANFGNQSLCSIKVEKILKGSLDLIPSSSPWVKIQNMGRKVCLRCKGNYFWALSTKFWKQKVCRHCPAIFCLITSSNFPVIIHNLNSHWRWWDQIQAIFLNLIYFQKCYLEATKIDLLSHIFP
jgi:hypothetical protein